MEWLASKSSRRFELYRTARQAYEGYLAHHRRDIGSGFESLDARHFAEAAADASLLQAARHYEEALRLTRDAGAMSDLATALYQLGMLLHLQGRFEPAEARLGEAQAIVDALPRVGTEELKVASGIHHHLGLVAWRQGRTAEGLQNLRRAHEIDVSIGDPVGQSISERAIERCKLGPPSDARTPA